MPRTALQRRLAAAPSLALQFLLELCALAAFSYWGATTGGSTAVRILLAIAAPIVTAIVWGSFGAPRAPFHLGGTARLLFELAFFAAAGAAFAIAWSVVAGVVFTLVVVLNLTLLHVLRPD